MAALKFADTHNMVAFLEKPTKSDGFEEIVDFLNAHSIRYALTINPTIYVSCIEQFWSTTKTKTINKETHIHALVDGKKIVITESSVRRDLQLAYEEGTSSDGGPRRQETMGDTIAQTWFENVSKTSNDSLLVGARVASSGEESLGGEDVSKQERKINDIDADEGVTLVVETAENQEMFNDEEIFDAGVLDGEEVFANAEQEVVAVNEVTTAGIEKVVSTAEVTTVGIEVTTASDLTLAQTLMEIRSARPKVKGVMIQEQEPEKPTKRKVQINLDEEAAQRLQVELQTELEEEERLAREKEEEANIALIESWDNFQATIDADYQMAEQLQAQEQKELTIEDKSKLFQQLLKTRRKHFAAKRAEEKRNKSPTKAQQRSIMCAYLKNMEGYKPKILKSKSFDAIQKLFDRAYKRVNTFEDFRTELEDDIEEAKLKNCLEIIPDEEEITIDDVPLAVKSPSIVDWKVVKDGKKSYYQIIRADRSSKLYLVFNKMLRSFDREDLETLDKLVKFRYKSTRPVEEDRVLWGDLMTMFEPNAANDMWRNQQEYKLLSWKMYDSC
ncbi:hypothetical protein Tco_0073150 [Tanacetum coccineum]